ncbi:uncharacterized protein LOC107865164 [Capsicum annuum]|uniref:uncharacterized protein LOC107865164 n=1 Tax=Capsicum annuum TaxID=4072 RepID=UPI0007BF8FD2|nr:uncharacterized protein LOC107865164 [Capsicum annuum]
MNTESHVNDGVTSVTITIVATTSRTNIAPAMAPAEKSEKFSGVDSKHWQQKMFFYLTTLSLQRFIPDNAPEFLEETSDKERFVYITEDTGTKKFFIVKFLDYKMIHSKTVVSQVQELQVIIHDLLSEGLIVYEAFQVATIIKKLSPLWKDLKNYLKYERNEVSVEDLIMRLCIEEDNKVTKKRSIGNSAISGANIMEDHPNNSKKSKKADGQQNNLPKKKFDGKCFNYGKAGHKFVDCRVPKKVIKKDQGNQAEFKNKMDDLCIMLLECNLVGNPRDWWIYSGATYHICANKDLFAL